MNKAAQRAELYSIQRLPGSFSCSVLCLLRTFYRRGCPDGCMHAIYLTVLLICASCRLLLCKSLEKVLISFETKFICAWYSVIYQSGPVILFRERRTHFSDLSLPQPKSVACFPQGPIVSLERQYHGQLAVLEREEDWLYRLLKIYSSGFTMQFTFRDSDVTRGLWFFLVFFLCEWASWTRNSYIGTIITRGVPVLVYNLVCTPNEKITKSVGWHTVDISHLQHSWTVEPMIATRIFQTKKNQRQKQHDLMEFLHKACYAFRSTQVLAPCQDRKLSLVLQPKITQMVPEPKSVTQHPFPQNSINMWQYSHQAEQFI